jgi:hypothetical protein
MLPNVSNLTRWQAMSEIRRKSLEELESEFADVMSNRAVTAITHFVPTNEGDAFDEVEIKRRAQQYAPEMRDVMQTMFE